MKCSGQKCAIRDTLSVHLAQFLHQQNTSAHLHRAPRQACLFQIISSDKINATVYEVIALMGHTPLRWHSVLHTLNMTPIAYCALSQVCLPFFSLPLHSSLSVPGPQRLYSGTDRLGVCRMPLCCELTLSWEPQRGFREESQPGRAKKKMRSQAKTSLLYTESSAAVLGFQNCMGYVCLRWNYSPKMILQVNLYNLSAYF